MRVVSIYLLIFMFIVINWPICMLGQWNSMARNQKSTLRPALERVFSRKKRWMIFPKGSNLKFTLNVSKRLLAMYPKGFNFNLEAAIYYPMPSTRIDLIPKRFRKPTSKAPSPRKPTPLYVVGVPGSLIEYRAKPAIKSAKIQRLSQNVSSLQWIEENPFLYKNNSSKWSKYNSPEYLKNYQWSPQKQQKYVNKYSKYNNKWKSPQTYSSTHYKWKQGPRYSRDIDAFDDYISSIDGYSMKYEPIYFEELEPFEDHPNYHFYRARRELFHHFEGLSQILGIDMKSCILRAVCDSKRFLLPPGYSMIQDILRVVFTFPTINGIKDEYSRIMDADYQICDAHIRNKCPFSILDWLLKSKNNHL